MFDGPGFPKSLDESRFETWLENGRASKIGYSYLLIIWNEYESDYLPIYAETREAFHDYQPHGKSTGVESIIAAYDLYSESRMSLPG